MSTGKIDRLMLRLKGGDKSVLGELYDGTRQAVFFAALRITRSRQAAEDVMQNVYIRLIEKISLFESGNAVGFLVTMSKNLALNSIKKESRTVAMDYSEHDIKDEKSISEQFETPLIEFSINKLPEDECEILLMAAVSGYKRKEIAKIMDIPLSTVTYKYLRAVKFVKENYKEADGE